MKLGGRGSDFNKGGGPGYLEGQLTRPPIDGPNQWSQGERLAWMLSQGSRMLRRGAKLHPVTRALDLIMSVWDVWNLINGNKKYPPAEGWDIPPGWNFRCGSPGGNHMATRRAVSSGTSPTICALTFQAVPNSDNTVGPTTGRSYHFGNKYAVGVSERFDYLGLISYLSPYTGPGPTRRPTVDLFVPMLTEPLPFAWANSATQPKTQNKPFYPVPPKPPPYKWPTPHKPPPPKTHEKKGQVAAAVGAAVKVAFAATEAVDAMEALYEALPDDIKKRTPKSGRTRKGALIGYNQPFATPLDKALVLWRNLRHVNMSEAVKNLIINHIVDYVIGTGSAKGADKLRKQLGASGWGNVI